MARIIPASNFEEAKARYISGICPNCGPKQKTEHRKKLADHFCHKCGEAWTMERIKKTFSFFEKIPEEKSAVATAASRISLWLFWKKFQKK